MLNDCEKKNFLFAENPICKGLRVQMNPEEIGNLKKKVK